MNIALGIRILDTQIPEFQIFGLVQKLTNKLHSVSFGFWIKPPNRYLIGYLFSFSVLLALLSHLHYINFSRYILLLHHNFNHATKFAHKNWLISGFLFWGFRLCDGDWTFFRSWPERWGQFHQQFCARTPNFCTLCPALRSFYWRKILAQGAKDRHRVQNSL